MAALTKAMQVSKTINNVAKLIGNLSLASSASSDVNLLVLRNCRIFTHHSNLIHTTSKRDDLMEFFDEKKNWSKLNIPHGRSWEKEELRLKSNEDLHKLWYVLLKERNMLLTMEEVYKQEIKNFPSPERIDKVEISMENLESVVRERNTAYYMLETGETGERPGKFVYSPLGLRYFYRMKEHALPRFMNTKWCKVNKFGFQGYAVRKFLRLYREKLWKEKRRLKRKQNGLVRQTLRAFPNVNIEALREKYPSANIDKIMKYRNEIHPHRVLE